jgi:hypothetical protein
MPDETNPDQQNRDAIRAEIAARETRHREGMRRAALKQQAAAFLADRALTRALNDPARTGPLPDQDEIRESILPLVPRLIETAEQLRQKDATLTTHTAFVAAVEQLEASPEPVPAAVAKRGGKKAAEETTPPVPETPTPPAS